MAQSKKVLLFIVEGIHDENTLGPSLKRVFANKAIHFHVVGGDITTNHYVTEANVIEKINRLVRTTMGRYGFQRSDIIRIVHLFDTDGAFIKESSIIADNNHKLQYELDSIRTNQVENIIKRNTKKAKILQKLLALPKLAQIQYTGYYFSRNLEHVLHGNIGHLENYQKRDLVDTFVDAYEDKPLEAFIQLFSNANFTVKGNYEETWEFIKQGTNSLHQYSNFHLLFQDKE